MSYPIEKLDGIFERNNIKPRMGVYYEIENGQLYGCLTFAINVDLFGIESAIKSKMHSVHDFLSFESGWEGWECLDFLNREEYNAAQQLREKIYAAN